MTEKDFCFWLCRIPGIGRTKVKALKEIFQSAEYLTHITKEELENFNTVYTEKHFDGCDQRITGDKTAALNERQITAILAAQKETGKIPEELEKLEQSGIRYFIKGEDGFPKKLLELPDCPEWLFVKGSLPDEQYKAAAIVGARNCTSYGAETAEFLAEELIRNHIHVISGLADGIDGCAHRGAVNMIKSFSSQTDPFAADSGSLSAGTFAVLGNGVDICYPNANSELYYDMSHGCGGLISEYLPGDKPLNWHFPYRNRIISGLADCVIVVEARLKSGSLITADAALEQEKDIYAVPGRMTDPLSQGCNSLIAQGAGIMTDVRSFIENEFGSYIEEQKKNTDIKLSAEEKNLLEKMSDREEHIEAIINRTGMPFYMLAPVLTGLKSKGLVCETDMNYYKRTEFYRVVTA